MQRQVVVAMLQHENQSVLMGEILLIIDMIFTMLLGSFSIKTKLYIQSVSCTFCYKGLDFYPLLICWEIICLKRYFSLVYLVIFMWLQGFFVTIWIAAELFK